MNVSGEWLNGPVQKVFHFLAAGGHQVYAVGGCVRNDLLGEEVNDVDLATDARPERVTELGNTAGYKVVPTGIEHGTVTVVVDGQGFEVTTFRKDVETDGRRAVVAYSDEIETDAKRRDFTINALYADARGLVFDPLGGLKDIPGRRIRFIDDADSRIKEDGLRILRFFRFYAAYGDPLEGVDPDGLAACASNLEMLDGLSAERIGAEIRKMLSAADPAPAVASMETSGVLHMIMAGAVSTGLAPLVHAESGRNVRWIRRLAAMGGLTVSARLRLSKAETKALDAIRTILEEGLDVKHAAYLFGEDRAVDAALIAVSLSGAIGQNSIEALAHDGARLTFPIKARMLMPQIPEGPELGAIMKRLEEAWVGSGFQMDKPQLLSMVDELKR